MMYTSLNTNNLIRKRNEQEKNRNNHKRKNIPIFIE